LTEYTSRVGKVGLITLEPLGGGRKKKKKTKKRRGGKEKAWGKQGPSGPREDNRRRQNFGMEGNGICKKCPWEEKKKTGEKEHYKTVKIRSLDGAGQYQNGGRRRFDNQKKKKKKEKKKEDRVGPKEDKKVERTDGRAHGDEGQRVKFTKLEGLS